MRTCLCYNVAELEKLLQGYKLERIKAIIEDEDDSRTSFEYHFVLSDVDHVHYYTSLFTSMIINMADGTNYRALSDNVNTSDANVLRITNNDIISPKLEISGNYVEATEFLRNWLLERGITENMLNLISKSFTLYRTVTYEGIPSISKGIRGWVYSSTDLVLDEREIEKVLNSIEDELLREKIKSILYARVFKKRY